MNDRLAIPADATHGQIEIAVGALYLSLAFALRHIAKVEGQASANAFKEELVSALKGGSISMSLLDDAPTFNFVVAMVDSVGRVEA
jgi:hypothetical protein